MHERAGRPEAGVVVCQPETLQVQHPDRVHHSARSARGLEMVAGQLRHEALRREAVQGAPRCFLVRSGLPARPLALDQQQLRGIQRGEDWQQVRDLRVRGHPELTRGKIEPGRVQARAVERERREVVVARGVELVGGQGRARRKDPRELAPHQFARLRRLGLVADRDLLPGRKQLRHIAVERVRR